MTARRRRRALRRLRRISPTEVPQPQTWQVPRERSTTLLLGTRRRAARTCAQQHRVTRRRVRSRRRDGDLYRSARTAARSTARTGAGTDGANDRTRRIRARVLVDASGRAGLLVARVRPARRRARRSPTSRSSRTTPACPRRTAAAPATFASSPARDLGWFWLIPISDDLMSVGVVLPQTRSKRCRSSNPDELLDAADRRHAGRRAPDGACRAAVAGPRRAGFLVRRDALRRRSLDSGRRRRFVPRSGVLERRRDRAWSRRSRAPAPSIAALSRGDVSVPRVSPLRSRDSASAIARSGGSCSASTRRRSAICSSAPIRRRRDVPGGRHRARRLLASRLGDPRSGSRCSSSACGCRLA